MLPQFGVALVHTPDPLTLALVPLLDERWLKRTLVHAEVSVVVEGGQVGQQRGPGALQRVHAGGVEEEGDGGVVTVSSSRRQTEAQVRGRREGGAHHVT